MRLFRFAFAATSHENLSLMYLSYSFRRFARVLFPWSLWIIFVSGSISAAARLSEVKHMLDRAELLDYYTKKGEDTNR